MRYRGKIQDLEDDVRQKNDELEQLMSEMESFEQENKKYVSVWQLIY